MGCGGSKETHAAAETDTKDSVYSTPRKFQTPRDGVYNNYNNYNNNNYNNNNNPSKNYYHNTSNKGSPLHSGGTQTYAISHVGSGGDEDFAEANDKQGYKRRIRNDLMNASAGSNIEVLEKNIEKFEKNRMEDCGDLTRAKERLHYLKLKRNLRDSIRRSHVGVLEKTISETQSSRYADQLRPQLDAAQRKLDQLRELNKYNHDILTMDQSTISEIHSYHRPPACVHDVMAATYMLLGHEESTLRDWSYLQSLAGKVGRDSLIHKVREFDPNDVDAKTSKRVSEILNYHQLGDVRVASSGAATFHVWASNMVNLIEEEGGQKNTSRDRHG